MSNDTVHATYCGAIGNLSGDGALIREAASPGKVLAQFDRFGARRGHEYLARGWHEFDATDFKVTDPEEYKRNA